MTLWLLARPDRWLSNTYKDWVTGVGRYADLLTPEARDWAKQTLAEVGQAQPELGKHLRYLEQSDYPSMCLALVQYYLQQLARETAQ